MKQHDEVCSLVHGIINGNSAEITFEANEVYWHYLKKLSFNTLLEELLKLAASSPWFEEHAPFFVPSGFECHWWPERDDYFGFVQEKFLVIISMRRAK